MKADFPDLSIPPLPDGLIPDDISCPYCASTDGAALVWVDIKTGLFEGFDDEKMKCHGCGRIFYYT